MIEQLGIKPKIELRPDSSAGFFYLNIRPLEKGRTEKIADQIHEYGRRIVYDSHGVLLGIEYPWDYNIDLRDLPQDETLPDEDELRPLFESHELHVLETSRYNQPWAERVAFPRANP